MSLSAGFASRDERDCLRSLLSKQMVPLGLLIVLGAVIVSQAAKLDFTAILAAVGAITGLQWVTAILAAAVSFWAIGRMDAVMHRLMNTGVSPRVAQLSGIASVATAQITGFGLLTGTLARWRVLPDINLWKAAQITGAVSASFMLALGVLVSVMVLLTGPDIALARPLAAVALVVLIMLTGATIWRPRGFISLRLPSLQAQASLLGLALLDTGAAALTLYVLIPEAQMPPVPLFYTVFLLALGAGLLGTTPGGVGPFEMIFILCLPALPEAPMLAAIMGYRLVYFALPAMLAAGVLILGPTLGRTSRAAPPPAPANLRPATTGPGQPVATSALSFNAARAEAGLMRQGEFDLLLDAGDRPLSMVAPAGQSLIMLSDPIRGARNADEALGLLHEAARQRFLTPCLYKCGARTAAVARRAGWSVLQIAQEARVSPACFDLDAPGARQLRRQLRKAQRAGISVTEAGARPPLDEMHKVAVDWAARRGHARGFSMGLFDEHYVSAQRVYLAHTGTDLAGFITLHETWRERALDLMCQRADAPQGTMHLLVHQAIADAARERCESLSLAAVPRLSDSLTRLPALAARVDRMTGAAGLARFKACFMPEWEPLYLAAPGVLGLTLAGLDLADRITRPRGEFQLAS